MQTLPDPQYGGHLVKNWQPGVLPLSGSAEAYRITSWGFLKHNQSKHNRVQAAFSIASHRNQKVSLLVPRVWLDQRQLASQQTVTFPRPLSANICWCLYANSRIKRSFPRNVPACANKALVSHTPFFLPASVQLNQRGVSVEEETREEQVNSVAVWAPRPLASTWATGVDITSRDHFINHWKSSVPNHHPLACRLLANHPTSYSRLSSADTSLLHSLLCSLTDKLSSPHGAETSLWAGQSMIL